jgi:hypothetical protein
MQMIKSLSSDLEIRKNNIFKLEERYLTEIKKNNILINNTGGMKNSDINKGTREAIVDIHAQTDQQGDLIKQIGADIKVSVNNMQTILTDVKQQGDTIVKISSNVQDANLAVKRTDKKITKMNNRNFLHKCLLHVLAIVLFIAIIVVVFLKIFNTK